MRRITVLDTTLRDGEQAPGCSMSMEHKMEIARELEKMKVDVIEAGFPVASPNDFASVQAIARMVKNCVVAGLCRATEEDIVTTWEAIRDAEHPRIHIFLATSDIHLEHKLKVDRAELLRVAESAVTLARSYCDEVQFTAEDATRSDPKFLLEVFSRVQKAGAFLVNIADTVGYATPEEMEDWVMLCKQNLPGLLIGVHCHNDLGMGTANTLSAVGAGADHVECTINGIGERAGMAALEEVIMALKTRKQFYNAETRVETKEFYRASKLLASIIDVDLSLNKPVVGKNAFAHEAGVHQHGVMSNPLTYEIMSPEDVGIRSTKFVLGKHSGKAALRERLDELGYQPSSRELEQIFTRFKALADVKREISDNDLEKLVFGEVKTKHVYTLSSFVVNSGTKITATAVVHLLRKGKEYEGVAVGETAVIAAFKAIDQIVQHTYPLHHYTIQSISSGRTELGESMVQVRSGDKVITGRGIDTDIVEACIKAYLSAINKALSEEDQ